MADTLDIEHLKTFVAISEWGSYSKAADEVCKTQSAVSMQMRRLEETVGRPLFAREGRKNVLTPDGVRLLDSARRILLLNNETFAMFSKPKLSGLVRFGTPDEYADSLLPEILARFSRKRPLVQVEVQCDTSRNLLNKLEEGSIDLALLTREDETSDFPTALSVPLMWVTADRNDAHWLDPVPIAVADLGCVWRKMATDSLDEVGKSYRIAYGSTNASAISAAVMAGLAVGAIPQLVIRPGMRVLGKEDGWPDLGDFEVGVAESPGQQSEATTALRRHIIESLEDEILKRAPAPPEAMPSSLRL